MIDGQKQREALSAAERALHLLEQGRHADAVSAAERAQQLDQIEAFAALPEAVARVAGHLETGSVPAAAWDALADAVGPGPLQSHVADLSR